MRVRFFGTLILSTGVLLSQAQNTFPATGAAGIGTTAPAVSSLLDIRSTTKGVLLPRMTTTQRNAIASPTAGLLIYQTDGTKGFYYYDGGWKAVAPATSGFANRSLNNLTTTSVNLDLVPGTTNTRNLGSSTKKWKDLYLAGNLRLDGDIYSGPERLIHNTGYFNLVIGELAGSSITDAVDGAAGNTVIGYESLEACTNCSSNTAVGHYTLRNTTGNDNSAFGSDALIDNSTGNHNTAVGSLSLASNTTASNNTAIGTYALEMNTTGSNNTANGVEALVFNTTGFNNTALGNHALQNNTTGARNTAVGDSAGARYTYNYSTFVGYKSTTSVSGLSNVTVLGYGATATASNQVRIGNSGVTSIGGKVSWTTLSDGRFKKNIQEDVPGLSFITKLRPVTYNLDLDKVDNANGFAEQVTTEDRPARAAAMKEKHTGFVAQEVEKAALAVKFDFGGIDKPKNDKDVYGLRYAEFVVPLVKAVQELDEKTQRIDALEKEVAELKGLVMRFLNDQGGVPTTTVNAYMEQNTPNPVTGITTIRYSVPQTAASARLIITNTQGQIIKTYILNNKGLGQVQLKTTMLAAGVYSYTLFVDGKQADAKQLVIAQ